MNINEFNKVDKELLNKAKKKYFILKCEYAFEELEDLNVYSKEEKELSFKKLEAIYPEIKSLEESEILEFLESKKRYVILTDFIALDVVSLEHKVELNEYKVAKDKLLVLKHRLAFRERELGKIVSRELNTEEDEIDIINGAVDMLPIISIINKSCKAIIRLKESIELQEELVEALSKI